MVLKVLAGIRENPFITLPLAPSLAANTAHGQPEIYSESVLCTDPPRTLLYGSGWGELNAAIPIQLPHLVSV